MKFSCDKYESLFVFGLDGELEEHLKICDDCRIEHEKQQEIKSLINEVAPFIKSKPSKTKKCYYSLVRIAATFFIAFLAFSLIKTNFVLQNTHQGNNSGKADSVISKMGLPTDDYGLLMVD
jgi:hypothetical protein